MNLTFKKAVLSASLLLGFVFADPLASSKGILMDFGAVDTLKALDKTDAIMALPKGNLPTYLSDLDLTNIEDSGGMKSPDLEKFSQLMPDFIVVSPRLGGRVDELSEYAPVLNFTVNPDNYFDSVSHNVLSLAKLVNSEDEAKEALSTLNARLDLIKADIGKSDKTAIIVMHNDGNFMATPTSNTAKFIHEFLGVRNAEQAPKEGRQPADNAYLQSISPDIIFIVDRSAAIGQQAMDIEAFTNNVTANVKNSNGDAVKVVYLDPTLWYLSGNGLISVEEEAKAIQSALK